MPHTLLNPPRRSWRGGIGVRFYCYFSFSIALSKVFVFKYKYLFCTAIYNLINYEITSKKNLLRLIKMDLFYAHDSYVSKFALQ